MTAKPTGPLGHRYQLKELIGSGGMASVYRATDDRLGRDVAIKVFRTVAIEQGDIERQQAEINVLASLSHHSLVTLFDVGVHTASPERRQIFLVMGAHRRRRPSGPAARGPVVRAEHRPDRL
ncbi:protein kinase domain-containing protein [Cryobacterium breve]|uniref:protein kinase domain-containing protein n=1 Tax=Cryobacterium breve TaxID=1259258 RepID=UPI00248AD64E|nr:hypothetical protein [Cryobacterium breve]